VTLAINSLNYVRPRLYKRVYLNKTSINDINNSINNIQSDLYTAVKGKNIIPTNNITIEAGYLRSDGRIWTN
jgi:hypothetical protein